jgi:predicted nucleic acid-binding protein
MCSADQSEARFLLDTNILVDFALDILREQLSDDERKAATFARELVLLSNCRLLIPEIAVSVEFPRAFLRAVLERHVTNEDKLKACINMLKYIERTLKRAGHEIVKCWDVNVLKTAAGWFYRIEREKGFDWVRRRHQDLIILATAKANNSGLITRNPDDFVEMMNIVSSRTPLCIVKVSGSQVQVTWLYTEPVDCVMNLITSKTQRHLAEP